MSHDAVREHVNTRTLEAIKCCAWYWPCNSGHPLLTNLTQTVAYDWLAWPPDDQAVRRWTEVVRCSGAAAVQLWCRTVVGGGADAE
eukprot:COSAG02_NODE_26631_length_628_cov_2.837429_1_plen_85_part_10